MSDMSNGYMKLHRQMLDWEWFGNSPMVHIWIYFLLKANEEDSTWQGIVVHRGSFVTSLDSISKDTNLSVRVIRTCIERLKATNKVTSKTTNRYTIITICNYDNYEHKENESDKQNDKPNDNQQGNFDKNSALYSIDNNNNVNDNINVEEKKKKEKIKKEKDEKFEECWLAYNRKGSKAKALEYWNKLSDADKALVLPHIKVYVSTRERVYQKDFERYLRDKIFKNIIVKGNDTIYDPEQFTNKEEYRPITDGVFQIWNPERKCLLFNGFIDQLNDGYTPDTRPDGAKVAWNMYEWVWSSQKKEWVKQ